MKKITECPICGNAVFDLFLTCTDFTTSNEQFTLQRCRQCTFVLTNPRPDDSDLEKYYESEKYISHTGKSYALFDSAYLIVRRFTLRWKTRMVAQYQPSSVLDYGCGTGEFLEACQAMGWDCVGVEPSNKAKSRADQHAKLTIATTLAELNGKKFDVITLWHVLEHIADLPQKMTELRNSLNENGILFVAVPNHTAYDAEVYREYWAAYDVPRHLWHFSRTTMPRLLAKSNFTVREIKPMKLDAFYVSLLSQKFKSGWHSPVGVLKAITTALTSNRKAKTSLNYSSLIYIATR